MEDTGDNDRRNSDSPVGRTIALMVLGTFLGVAVTGLYKMFDISHNLTVLTIEHKFTRQSMETHHIRDDLIHQKMWERVTQLEKDSHKH